MLIRLLALVPGAAGLYAASVGARILGNLDAATWAFIRAGRDPDFAADYGLFYAAACLGALFLVTIGGWAAVLTGGVIRGRPWALRHWVDLTIVSFVVSPLWLWWKAVSRSVSPGIVSTYAVVLGSLLLVARYVARTNGGDAVPPQRIPNP